MNIIASYKAIQSFSFMGEVLHVSKNEYYNSTGHFVLQILLISIKFASMFCGGFEKAHDFQTGHNFHHSFNNQLCMINLFYKKNIANQKTCISNINSF